MEDEDCLNVDFAGLNRFFDLINVLSNLTAHELEFTREEIRNLLGDIAKTNREDIIFYNEAGIMATKREVKLLKA